LFEEAAPIVMMRARAAVDIRGRFVIAISGGSTPKGLFQQLREEPVLNLMPWDKTFVFWVDERHVPLDHPDSNYRMAQENLLSKVPIPKENIFPMTKGTLPVDQAASSYENKILRFFGTETKIPRFDLVLLGMGEDGHTASLFPGVQYLNETDKWVVGYAVDAARKERVTLTFPVLNAARMVMALVEGEKKADRVKEVLEGPKDPPKYPIQYVRPTDGHFDFLLDASAGKKLSKIG
jgi:6-phosphogluconolactonase